VARPITQTGPQRPTPAEVYESVFMPALFQAHSLVVLDLADPQPGERVLDLACGTGIVARTVAPILEASQSISDAEVDAHRAVLPSEVRSSSRRCRAEVVDRKTLGDLLDDRGVAVDLRGDPPAGEAGGAVRARLEHLVDARLEAASLEP
jgi:hypothetical protein